jgi:hypothetical protein
VQEEIRIDEPTIERPMRLLKKRVLFCDVFTFRLDAFFEPLD